MKMGNKTEGVVKLYLRTGTVFMALYDIDEYDYIYDCWANNESKVLGFNNCCIKAKDVVLIEYVEEESDNSRDKKIIELCKQKLRNLRHIGVIKTWCDKESTWEEEFDSVLNNID